MTDDTTRPNGIRCWACDAESETGSELDDECPECGSNDTQPMIFTDCPNGAGKSEGRVDAAQECDSDYHDWGTGKHQELVDR